MSRLVRPPHSVVLVVGREQFTVPGSFAGRTCVATADCLAISVVSVEASATQIGVADGPDPRDGAGGLARLGEFQLETEGLLSVRDVYSREYENVGVTPGLTTVTVWGDEVVEPSQIVLQVAVDRAEEEYP